jgi:exodeoxyribonuclease VII small subunit
MPTKEITSLSFEEAFGALQAILKQMEEENLPLSDALAYYEEGQKLTAHCTKLLEEAELKLETLKGN